MWVKPARDKKGNVVGPNAVNPKYGTPKCEFITQLVRVDESHLCSETYPGATWVGAHPSLGEAIAKELIERNALPGMDIQSSQSQVSQPFPNMRPDFLLTLHNTQRPRIVEVKTVVDTDYSSHVPLPDRDKCVYTSDSQPYQRLAIFPWGQGKQKGPDNEPVVSARAIKHVQELTKLVEGGAYDATILFIVIRNDAQAFRPNHEACPSFAKYLKLAQDKGVQLLAKRVRWDKEEGDDGIARCYDDKWLDIVWPS